MNSNSNYCCYSYRKLQTGNASGSSSTSTNSINRSREQNRLEKVNGSLMTFSYYDLQWFVMIPILFRVFSFESH